MANPVWRYDSTAHRYRNTRTGRFISLDDARAYRDEFADAIKDRADVLTSRLAAGEITIGQWVTQAREDLKIAYLNQYALGRGGFAQMKPEDYGSIGGQLANQYAYLQDFAEEIAQGGLTEGQIRARLRMYFESSTQAFERAKARAFGLAFDALPAYPGDGKSECLSNCRCGWELKLEGSNVAAYWRLSRVEHCETCKQRGRDWSPLVVQGERVAA